MGILTDPFVFFWDFLITLYNVATPNIKGGDVVPKGHPGMNGLWPEYIAPREGDSRSACPMLNALANHGILPRDGKNISFKEMNKAVRHTYNFAPSFCYFVPNYIAAILKKSYEKDTFDLAEISLHNGIEHDASLTREDTYHQPDQGKPHVPFINELLACASGKSKGSSGEEGENNVLLTSDDLARYSAIRRTEAQARNPEFSLSTSHKMFGSSNSSTLLIICGGRVSDIRSFLIDERIPDKWESAVRSRLGLTFARFNFTVLPLEIATRKYVKEYANSSSSVKKAGAQPANYGATAGGSD